MKQLIIISIIALFFSPLICLSQNDYEVRKLSVNSEYSDFGVMFKDNTSVIFSSAMSFSGNAGDMDDDGNPFLSLYEGRIASDNDISNVKKIKKHLSVNYHQSNAVFTQDGKTVYFSASNIENEKLKKNKRNKNIIQLYRANVSENGLWTSIEKLPFNSDDFQTGHPVLNVDDSILYFISDRPESIGGTDIFYVVINNDGTYGTPQNMGDIINTKGREMFPYVDRGTNKMYFSSDGHQDGLGGLDIYVVDLNDNMVASQIPIHFEEPINTDSDDFSFVTFPGEPYRGFLSSNRLNEKNDDIYYFQEINNITSNCSISGKVFDDVFNASLEGTLISLLDQKGQLVDSVRTDNQGIYKFNFPCTADTKNFVINVKNNDFDEINKSVTLDKNTNTNSDFKLVSKEFAEGDAGTDDLVLKIQPIYFNYGKSGITTESIETMERIVTILNKYPNLKLRIESHTDSQSSKQFNQNLSESRALSAAQWLIDNGIGASRLESKGFGESQLLNHCADNVTCTDEEHAINRRINFVIINKEDLKENITVDEVVPDAKDDTDTLPVADVQTDAKDDTDTLPVADVQTDAKDDTDTLPVADVQTDAKDDTGTLPVADVQTDVNETPSLIDISLPILFQYGTCTIEKESLIAIREVATYLKTHPDVNIRIEAHTDSRSSKEFNQRLSETRAESTLNQLVDNGIAISRLQTRGYGESKLLNHCTDDVACTEAEHAVNRRIDFVILNNEVFSNDSDAMEIASSNTPVDTVDFKIDSQDFIITDTGRTVLNIPPISFAYGKPNIEEESLGNMQSVMMLLNKYPDITLRIESHTDSQSSEAYNIQLSEARSQYSLNWLIDNGIDASRLEGIGYGEAMLLNHCDDNVECTEEQHAINRRTDFVVSNDFVLKN